MSVWTLSMALTGTRRAHEKDAEVLLHGRRRGLVRSDNVLDGIDALLELVCADGLELLNLCLQVGSELL